MFYCQLILIVSLFTGFSEQGRISRLNAYCSDPENYGRGPSEVKCGKNAQCNTYLNVCQCPVGFVPNSNGMDCVRTGCKLSTECLQFSKYAVCRYGNEETSRCMCPDGLGLQMSHKNLSMCATNIDRECETDYECGKNAYCRNRHCTCKPKYIAPEIPNTSKINCVPELEPVPVPEPVVLSIGNYCGEYSNTRTKCGQNAICHRGTTCECLFGYESNGKDCHVIDCSADRDCPSNARCVSRMCQCKPDYGLNVRTQTCQANFSLTLTCAYAYIVIEIIAFLI